MLGTKIYKNDMSNYSTVAVWCNQNNATIVDKGEYYECVLIPAPALDEIKADKIAELKIARDTEELSPVSYGGYMWDFDDKAQMRINGGIVALSDGGTITWTSADNVEIRGVDADDLRNVIKSASVRSNAVHVKYRELRERVERANTVEEINNIEW